MPRGNPDQRSESRKRDQRVQVEAVANIGETDHRVVAMHVWGQYPGEPDVESDERNQSVAEGAGSTPCGPWNRFPVSMRLCTVSLQGLVSPVKAQGDARGNVHKQRKGNDKRLGQGRLIVGAGEKKEAVALGDGPGDERDQGRVCNVEGSENGEGV